jgi:hypothetical protein
MAPVSIQKTSTGSASPSISFDTNGITACCYFDLISDEMYARGRRMKVTKHFANVFGLLPTTTSKIREASKGEAVPFNIPPEPESIPPCEDPVNFLARQNANPFDMLYDPTIITANQPMIILPASDFDPHSIQICDLVLKCIPENLEDRVAWRRLQNLVHLS